MIKFEHTEVMGWEAAIRGMRNPMNSWEKSDSAQCRDFHCGEIPCPFSSEDGYSCDGIKAEDYILGPNDMNLMRRLAAGGSVHAKYRRMITVYVDITAPLYWWKEFSTYKVGTVANSCSTMHKIHAKEFTMGDFSTEHLSKVSLLILENTIKHLNWCREVYLENKDKGTWWQMIQLLPSSYNQKRTIMMNYEVLANIYKSRKNHKLDEWSEHVILSADVDHKNLSNMGFCDWIKTLPYSELITQEVEEND